MTEQEIQEKAKALVERFYEQGDRNLLKSETHINWDCAKQCAIICVDEILKTVPQKENEIFGISKGMDYWEKIKQAIEKL